MGSLFNDKIIDGTPKYDANSISYFNRDLLIFFDSLEIERFDKWKCIFSNYSD